MPGYNVGFGGPYAGPTRAGPGDPAFDAWQKRQFSQRPFSQSELSSGANVMPQFAGQGGGGGGGRMDFQQMFQGADPRQITNSPAWQRLMGLSNSNGVSQQARADVGPAMAQLRQFADSPDPLGTSNLPNLVRSQGAAQVRGGGETARRNIAESSGGQGARVSSEAMQFMREMSRIAEGGAMGGVEAAANQAKIQEREATAQFRRGAAESMANLGLGLGNIGLGEQGQQIGAAGQAGAMESSARNNWAQLIAQLLGQQIGYQNQPFQPSRPLRGGTYDDNGNYRPTYDQNPFKGGYDFGSYLNGRNF